MLTRNEFDRWFDDYRARFPSVAEYVRKQSLPSTLLDTWYANLAAFDAMLLGEVTGAIVAGDTEPIPNVHLGTFGAEIRGRCRQILDRRRRRDDWKEPLRETYQPLMDANMSDMMYCGLAVDDLLGIGSADEARLFRDPGSVSPDHPQCGAYCAAIILADEHSAWEETRCLAKLAEHGLTWEQVRARAAQLRASKEDHTNGQVRP